jgi:hypothetical protein
MDHDIQELIGKVAEQNGIRLDQDDPAFALVTLSELVLKATAAQLREEIQATIDRFSESVQRLDARAGAVVAHEVKQAAAEMRRHLANDLAAGGLKARELIQQVNAAHQQPAMLRWATVGLLSAGFFLVCGFPDWQVKCSLPVGGLMRFWWFVALLLGRRYFARYVLVTILGLAFLFYCLVRR